MQDAEDEGKVHAGHQGPTGAEGSVLTYVTEAEFRKQLYVPWHPYGSRGVADRLRATVSTRVKFYSVLNQSKK